MDRPNYITPAGYTAMRAEYQQLFETERPALVEVISWAAGNGDRSENGDYIYGRKKLREIDRRLNFLSRRMKAAQVVDPAGQADRGRVFFGATVTLENEELFVFRMMVMVSSGNTRLSPGNKDLAKRLRLDKFSKRPAFVASALKRIGEIGRLQI